MKCKTPSIRGFSNMNDVVFNLWIMSTMIAFCGGWFMKIVICTHDFILSFYNIALHGFIN